MTCSPHRSGSKTLLSVCTLLLLWLGGTGLLCAQEEDKAALGQLDRELKDLSTRLRGQTNKLGTPPSPDALVRSIRDAKRSPQALLSWVHDNVAYEPYEGALRGGDGALLGLRGNAVDQALLLQSLYQAAGFKTRLAWGQASGEQAMRLLHQVSPESYLASKGELLKNPAYALFLPRHRRAAQAHVWVEVAVGEGGWVAADPLLGQRLGDAPVKKQGSGEMPPGAQGVLEVSVQATLDDGRVLKLVEAGGPLWRFAKVPLHLRFEADATLKGAVRPVLRLGQKMERGDYFPAAGLKSLVIKSRVKIGGTQYMLEQPLHEVQSHKLFTQANLPHLSMMVVPYWVDQRAMWSKAAGELGQAVGQLGLLVKERERGTLPGAAFTQGVNGFLDAYAPAIAIGLLGHTDAAARGLARTLGVEPVLERPRIVFMATSTHGDTLHTEVDVHGYRVDAVSHRGVPQAAAQAFVTLFGRMENQVRSRVLKAYFSPPPYSTTRLFEDARAQNISVLSLHEAEKSRFTRRFGGNDQVKTHLLALSARGDDVMVIPKAAVSMEGQQRVGWWQIDPIYGSVVGEGWHGLFDLGAPKDQATEPDQVRVLQTLTNHLGSAERLWEGALLAPPEHPQICAAAKDLVQIAKVACATKRMNTLPSLEACLGGNAKASEAQNGQKFSASKLPTQLSMGDDPLGLGEEPKAQRTGLSCASALVPMQCGVVVGEAFLAGGLVATPKQEVAEDGPAKWEPVRCK